MTNLENALIQEGLAENEKQANEIVRQMLSRIKGGFENAADVLEEYGLEGTDGEESLIEDIFNWKQYGSGAKNEPSPNPAPIQEKKDEEKMMFKIKALIDKAESTDSQEEKDAFMMKAQELIQKNNLSFERIRAVEGTRNANGVITDEAIDENKIKYDEEWDRQLITNVALGNMCKIIYNTSERKVYVIGKSSNVSAVTMLCDFYRKAILNLALEAAKRKTRLSKTLALSGGKKMISSRELVKIEKEEIESISDYLFGAVAGLKDALTRKEQDFSSSEFTTEDNGLIGKISGREVIRRNVDKIQEYISKTYPFLGRASFSGGGNSNSMSYQRGHSDGGGLGSGQRRLN